MLLLNTEGKMNIVETEQYNIVTLPIEDSALDLKMSELRKYVGSLIDNIDYEDNVVLQLEFSDPTPLEDVADSPEIFIELIIEAILLDELEEKVWQPRTTLVDRINMPVYYQTQLINHNIKFNNFTIKIRHNKEEIYEMID
jgi:hypothetical protein